MIDLPVVSSKFLLHKHLLKRAIAIERAEFKSRLETYQNLKQKIVSHHGGSRLEPTAEEFQTWREAVDLARQRIVCRHNIF